MTAVTPRFSSFQAASACAYKQIMVYTKLSDLSLQIILCYAHTDIYIYIYSLMRCSR
jgi:hypothetical protein